MFEASRLSQVERIGSPGADTSTAAPPLARMTLVPLPAGNAGVTAKVMPPEPLTVRPEVFA